MKDKIEKIILKNKELLIGKHSHDTLKSIIENNFRKYRVRVNIVPSFDDIGLNLMGFGGSYDDESDMIDLDIFVTDTEDNIISIPESFWGEFKFKLMQLLAHEIIHRNQFIARDGISDSKKYRVHKNPTDDQKYLSDADEIDAYSHDIALEILNFYKKSEKTDIFSSFYKKSKLESLSIYKKTFENTNWTKIYRKLVKKSYKWVDYYEFR